MMPCGCIISLLLVDFGGVAILHAVGLGLRLAHIGRAILVETVLPLLVVAAVATSGSAVLDLFFE